MKCTSHNPVDIRIPYMLKDDRATRWTTWWCVSLTKCSRFLPIVEA
jgi:hypothetical protein